MVEFANPNTVLAQAEVTVLVANTTAAVAATVQVAQAQVQVQVQVAIANQQQVLKVATNLGVRAAPTTVPHAAVAPPKVAIANVAAVDSKRDTRKL
jgi:hypothetical protein